MSATDDSRIPVPTALTLRKGAQTLEVVFPDGVGGALSAEYLRTHSPSAEVAGHGGGERALVTGKTDVRIARIEPVGRYAVRLVFDDGHDTGLFTWPVLYALCRDQASNWRRYLERLHTAGHGRAAAPGEPRMDD